MTDPRDRFFTDEEYEAAASIAEKVFSELSEKNKAYIRENPVPWDHHFSLGLHIRNHYLFTNSDSPLYSAPGFDADVTSHAIVEMVIEKVLQEGEKQQD